MINVRKLDQELRDYNIPFLSVNSNGIISFKPEAKEDQIELAQQIVSNHNPLWYVDLRTGPEGYKPIGDQLDMIYRDKLNGTNTWFEHIQDVKTRFPK